MRGMLTAMPGSGRREEETNGIGEEEEEHVVDDLRDTIDSSRGSRLNLLKKEIGFEPARRIVNRENVTNGINDLSKGMVIHPDNRWYRAWTKIIFVWAVYSSFFTPMEFGFFRGLPRKLFLLDIVGQVAFLVDIILQFFVAYRDSQTYKIVYKRTPIALRYLKSSFVLDLLACMPWDVIYRISQTLYKSYVENVPLFKGCSSEFINQIVVRVQEEFFLPGEVIMEQGNVVDQLYFVCHGTLEEVGIMTDGSEESVSNLEPNSSFGEISILCNIPHPYTVRVCELCRLLRVDKRSFSNILEIYFHDGRIILNNLLEGNVSNVRVKQLESDITFHIGKQEAELALRVNSAAHHGDLHQLKRLIRAGADPDKTNYDGRSPLHLAASRGYEDIILFLIQEDVDINISDKFGNTPLLEALKNGHDIIASILVKEGAELRIDAAGSFLCTVVARGDSDFLKRILSNGIDPNSKDYNHRTPLHVAASEGLYLMTKLLLGAGASVFSKDRWGNTPLDEAQMCGNNNLIKLLEEAKSTQLSEFPDCSHETTDNAHLRKCTVFPFHPWDPKDKSKHGIVLWVPQTIEELIKTSAEKLDFPSGSCILSEDAGKIPNVDMISDGQKLYLISQTN